MNQKIKALKRLAGTTIAFLAEAVYVVCSLPVKIMENWRGVRLSTEYLLRLRKELLEIQAHPFTWGYPRLDIVTLISLRQVAYTNNRPNLELLYRELLDFDGCFNKVQHQSCDGGVAWDVAIKVYLEAPKLLAWIDAQTDNFYARHR